MRNIRPEEPTFLQRKVPLLSAIVAVFVLIVLSRLFYLQVFRGKSYRTLSQQISVREEELRARRGLILDRHGKILADNRSSSEIVIIPQFAGDPEKVIESLTRLLPMTAEEIEKKLAEGKINPPFLPVTLAVDAPYEWVAKIRENVRPDYSEDSPYYLKGVEVRITPLRSYPHPELFSHVLGYIKEVDGNDLKKFSVERPDRYSLGDFWGAAGLEKAFDLELRGFDGVNARVVDARGKEIRQNPDLELLEKSASFSPTDGHHLVTTLDYDAQAAAAEAFGKRRGGVVALDPNTGEVLVLFSSPGYDANRIIKNIDREYWKMINLDEDKYLFNRAIQGTYPPGSTYKIVDAIGSLMQGKITPETSFSCGGGMQFGNRFFQCWKGGGHGPMQLVRGITQSCDVFFYNVGLKLGVDGIKTAATLLGLG
ncbi:MAG: penicillin-binding transpeptidase domain-containing protein, partial [Deltaproteobacteria bacterium]|nr:penicillin-binding transpeptidase domain-containing protein [Deltaproteobacteria bacterium]